MVGRIGIDGKLYDMANQDIRVIYNPETRKEPSRRSIEQELDEKLMELNHVLNRLR